MPGTMTISTPETFASVIFMGSGPKQEFGTDRQAISASGERKWEVQCAVTFHAEYGMRPVAEVITVTVMGTDPGAGIQPGTQVEFDHLRVGFSAPEKRENGRIAGGRPWYQANGVRPLGVRPGKQEQAA